MTKEQPQILLGHGIWLPLNEPECTFCVSTSSKGNDEIAGHEANGILAATLEKLLKTRQPGNLCDTNPPALELECLVMVDYGGAWNRQATTRALITYCGDGNAISVTLRFDDLIYKALYKSEQVDPKLADEERERERKKKQTELNEAAIARAQKKGGTGLKGLQLARYSAEYFLQTDAVVDTLIGQLFSGNESSGDENPIEDTSTSWKLLNTSFQKPLSVRQESGVLVFSGATKSGKTRTSMSLVLRYLLAMSASKAQKSPPHLVTVEDPLEEWRVFAQETASTTLRKIPIVPSDWAPWPLGIWFTPRHRPRDVKELNQAYQNALRQTPACVFVGEVRAPSDWEWVMELGATGHLVVTTMHAASVTEAMMRISQARNVSTPFDRANLARVLLGVCHLGRVKATPEIEKEAPVMSDGIVLPSLWKRTPMSIAAFASDGLASVIPNGEYVFGRRQFAESAIKRNADYNFDEPAAKKQILSYAQTLDLTDF